MTSKHDDAAIDGLDPEDETPPDGQRVPDTSAATPEAKARTNGHTNGVGRPPQRRVPAMTPPLEEPRARETAAHLVWQEMIDRFAAEGGYAGSVTIFVTRMEPHPEMALGSFSGDAVPGGADDFYAYLVNNFHARATMKGPALYSCRFNWKGTTKFNRVGTIRLPPMEEIAGMGPPRAYGAQGSMGAPPYVQQQYARPTYEDRPPQPTLGWDPHARQWVLPPQPQAPRAPELPPAPHAPQGFGAPPQQDPQVADLRAQVGYLSGQLAAVLDAFKSGQNPAQAAAQVVAPATAAPVGVGGITAADVAREMLKLTGAAPAAAVQTAVVAATKPSDAAGAAFGEIRALLGVVKGLKTIVREFDETFAPPDTEQEDLEPPVDLPREEESLPFGLAPLPNVMFLGHPGQYARDKETGKISIEGMLLSNPGLAERLIDIAEKFADGAKAFAQRGLGASPAPPAQATPAPSPALHGEVPGAGGNTNDGGDGWPTF